MCEIIVYPSEKVHGGIDEQGTPRYLTDLHPVIRWSHGEYNDVASTRLEFGGVRADSQAKQIEFDSKYFKKLDFLDTIKCHRVDLKKFFKSKLPDQFMVKVSHFNSEKEILGSETITVNIRSNEISLDQIIEFDLKKPIQAKAIENPNANHIAAIKKKISNPEKETPSPQGLRSSCFNGDLENGDFSGWQAYSGDRSNQNLINLNAAVPGFVVDRHRIMSVADGNDPYAGPKLPSVSEGNFSAKLGNDVSGGDYSILAYTMTVDPANPTLEFRYACVLDDPNDDSHSEYGKPAFSFYIVKGNTIFPSFGGFITGQRIEADINNPFFQNLTGNWVCRGWTPTCVNLSAYAGEQVTIVFIASDCNRTGHAGYAYIDGICVSNSPVADFQIEPEVCASKPLIADGTASLNETSHFWSIQESDANWNSIGPEYMDWFVAQQAGPINLSDFINSKGGTLKCNTYYRVKLAVSNDCVPWVDTTKLIKTYCPEADAGPDLCVCIDGSPTPVVIGSPTADPSLNYMWFPSEGLDDRYSPTPTHNPGSSTYPKTYTLAVWDDDSCGSFDSVTLYCGNPTLQLTQSKKCCHVEITATSDNIKSISWSTGETGIATISVTEPGNYSASVSNPCGDTLQSITVAPSEFYDGPFPSISYNSKAFPDSSSSSVNKELFIMDVDFTGNNGLGTPGGIGAYNATGYRLLIFNRWGSLIRTIEEDKCEGFANWEISWDCEDNSGNIVQQGQYNWRLWLKNCDHNYTQPKIKTLEKRCVKWFKLFGKKLFCIKSEWYPIEVQHTVETVTVVR